MEATRGNGYAPVWGSLVMNDDDDIGSSLPNTIVIHVTDQPGHRSLHSASTIHLVVPPVRLSAVANYAFSVVAAHPWNDLLADVMTILQSRGQVLIKFVEQSLNLSGK